MIAVGSMAALDLIEQGDGLREQLAANSTQFRSMMTVAGFKLAGGGHPIIPVMLGDARVATEMSNLLLDEGIYVVGFSFPVVPQGQARIRTQMSASHTSADIDLAVGAFVKVGRSLGVVP
jgi:glycine C-acetyltransferase